MNAALAYQAAWNAAFTGGARGRRMFPIAAGAAALLFAAGGVLRHAPPFEVLRLAVAAAAGTALFGALIYFIPGAVLLNTPANARLVPGMRRRLVEMTAAGWLLGSVLVAGLAGWLALAPLVAMYVIGLSMMRAGHQWGLALFMPAVMFGGVQRSLPPELLSTLASGAGFFCEMLLLALVAVGALGQLYPKGGDRHFGGRHGQERAIERSLRKVAQPVTPTLPGRVFGWGLQRDCQQRRLLSLMLHVLGPSAHWSAALVMGLFVLAVGIAVKAALALWASDEIISSVAAGGVQLLAAFVMVVAQAGVAEQVVARIGAARTEQALFRLAPASPPPAVFNRLLGAALASRVLLNWLVLASAIAIVAALLGTPAEVAVSFAAVCSMAGLPLVGIVLDDYARDRGAFDPGVALSFVFISAPAVLAACAAWRWDGLAFWPSLLVASNTLGAGYAVWRWTRLRKAPVAFPARRMS
ncbi:hypothetical protein NX774_19195 [Massilia agilis]|uniref:ABC-2 type transport system permease protein n=1 Tax=Massilia agilis TaxID=1811226 RepID=A0ABT2DFG4_9BURK|nr:hypothetical protein [Massilia agilis]MCS0810055.1 hypothetical protein [Massilia agilis]